MRNTRWSILNELVTSEGSNITIIDFHIWLNVIFNLESYLNADCASSMERDTVICCQLRRRRGNGAPIG